MVPLRVVLLLLLSCPGPDARLHRAAPGGHLALRNLHEARENYTPAPRRQKRHRDVCAEEAVCVAPVQCPAHVRDEGKQACNIIGGRRGVCCTSGQNHTSKFWGELCKFCGAKRVCETALKCRCAVWRHSALRRVLLNGNRLWESPKNHTSRFWFWVVWILTN